MFDLQPVQASWDGAEFLRSHAYVQMKRKKSVRPRRPTKSNAVSPLASFLSKHEVAVVGLLCGIACVRIFVFSSAFPFFNNVDETEHFDLVSRYSSGDIPRGIELPSVQGARLIAYYATPEYLNKPEESPTGSLHPPVWTVPAEVTREYLNQMTAHIAHDIPNHEGVQPPLYYILAGGWYRLGKVLGLKAGSAMYWVRFLNVVVYALLVWVSYVFAKKFYPTRQFLRIGLPLVLAFFPQDLFFGLTNNVLFAPLFAVSLYCLLDINTKGYGFHALTGLMVSATLLAGLTNAPILAMLILVAASRLRKARATGKDTPRILLMLTTAALPMGLWFAWNYATIGHITASSQYTRLAEWTVKPFREMFDHPVFSASGLAGFWSDLMSSFWRGAFVWLRERLALRWCDAFYYSSSLLFILASGIGSLRNYENTERIADRAGFLLFGLSVAMLVAMSMLYDFGDWPSPSREFPWFAAGRLISGTLVPFLILYLKGLDLILTSVNIRVNRLLALVPIVALMAISEVVISLDVFKSEYNWFHMPK